MLTYAGNDIRYKYIVKSPPVWEAGAARRCVVIFFFKFFSGFVIFFFNIFWNHTPAAGPARRCVVIFGVTSTGVHELTKCAASALSAK